MWKVSACQFYIEHWVKKVYWKRHMCMAAENLLGKYMESILHLVLSLVKVP